MTSPSGNNQLPEFLAFLEAEGKHPPASAKARAVWSEMQAELHRLSGNLEGQGRFLKLLAGEVQPISTQRSGAAAAFTADHAYNLFKKLERLDRPWRERVGARLLGIGGSAGAGALIKWVAENWDKIGAMFGLAALIGFLVMDDAYDGGSLLSFAAIGALFGILFLQTRRRNRGPGVYPREDETLSYTRDVGRR